MSHTQIGKEDYACISKMLRAGYSYSEIARTINKHASSISKHIREHGGRDAYDTKEARRKKHQKRILAMESIRILQGPLLRSVVTLLKKHLSPEQISGSLAIKGKHVDSSTIYRYIDERAPHLKQYLRSQKGK